MEHSELKVEIEGDYIVVTKPVPPKIVKKLVLLAGVVIRNPMLM